MKAENQRAESINTRIDTRYKDENKGLISSYNDVSERLQKELAKPKENQNAAKITKLTTQRDGIFSQLEQAKTKIKEEENAKVPKPSPTNTAKGGKGNDKEVSWDNMPSRTK